ncbi:hypothetical protein BH23PLA1_BH23PLA1_29120 [soil metagenome]
MLDMTDMVTQLWENLRSAGIPEVMLYLPDGSACRCHWENTALIGSIRVALLGDQERGIVRIIPISACAGIGIPSPKGTDPNGYRSVIQQKLADQGAGPN